MSIAYLWRCFQNILFSLLTPVFMFILLSFKQCLHQRSFTSCCSKLYRTAEEEEGIRASEAIDRILSRLSKSDVVVKGKPIIQHMYVLI